MRMHAFPRLCAVFFLAVALFGYPPDATAVDEELAKELKSVLLQQRQLKRNAREFRLSIQMLETQPEAGNDNALQALRNQLTRANSQLQILAYRRAELEKALGIPSDDTDAADRRDTGEVAAGVASTAPPGDTPAPADKSPAAPDPAAPADAVATSRSAGQRQPGGGPQDTEASRLTELLNGYYAGEAGTEPANASGPGGENGARQPAIDPEKIRLTGAEGLVAIDLIADRLASGPQSIRREVDIVFHVEVRQDGKLVSSTSHSLRSLGKSQYIAKVELQSGRATITVRREDRVLSAR